MKIGLVYATRTGHSRKIARSIAEELHIEAVDIGMNPKLEGIDLLYIVGGIYGGKSAPKLVEFVRTIKKHQVKRVALITSSAGKSTPQAEVRKALLDSGIDVIKEEFMCQGGFLFVGLRHPNQNDIKNAISFVRETSKRLNEC